MALGLGCSWLLGLEPAERVVARLSKLSFVVLLLGVGRAGLQMAERQWDSLHAAMGSPWFEVGNYGFELSLQLDLLSLPLVALTVLLAALIGSFSTRYLHRDPGYLRFFLLLQLFTAAALLLFMADGLDGLLAGWELVGITSVLLIAFFQTRPEPVRNALRVFGTYRAADLFMLLAVFLAHHGFHTASWAAMFSGQWPAHASAIEGHGLGWIAALLVMAASGKSAQGPFCGWLARAMEGPTPSSAIFYGAISVHAGIYLLLRVQPLIASSEAATVLLLIIGATTALLGTLVHRTCADVKTSLTYAVQTQLGLIFVEIALGWTQLALLHLVSHALLRTLQFLRAPSMLRDHHRVHAAAGGELEPTGAHWEQWLPKPLQLWLYRVALGRGFYDPLVDRLIIAPIEAVARMLRRLEPGPH
jgi:NADH:ubiquinone oxidoreductase subunit 5 (subunit L)/multisubunit Na+/H+ antiporter MnhA subunit